MKVLIALIVVVVMALSYDFNKEDWAVGKIANVTIDCTQSKCKATVDELRSSYE